MFRFSQFAACVGICILFATCADANAQRTPNVGRRPTVSPLINLFNPNQGGINNYFSFVRPLQRQARLNQQQFNQNQLLQQQLANQQFNQGGAGRLTIGLQPQAGGVQGMFRPAAQGVGMPSTAATYFNHSHFYPVPPPPSRSRR